LSASLEPRNAAQQLDLAFGALADGSRREVIRLLLQRPRRPGELAACIAMSPQALSRHLRVLRRAGLIAEQGVDGDARVRLYSVHPAAFQPVQSWMSQVEDLWRRQLESFKSYAESTHRHRKMKS
jgi:DNA-binding transcriptional ArsR family regulator